MTAVDIIELAALRQVDPMNPLADRLITEQIESGQAPDRIFYARLQAAWRDGRLSSEEVEFCKQMRIDPRVFVRMRVKFAPTKAGDPPAFERIKAMVFDL